MNKPSVKHEPDTLVDTRKGGSVTKVLKVLEASTGIEPVYTDLQSAASPLRQLAEEVRAVYAEFSGTSSGNNSLLHEASDQLPQARKAPGWDIAPDQDVWHNRFDKTEQMGFADDRFRHAPPHDGRYSGPALGCD